MHNKMEKAKQESVSEDTTKVLPILQNNVDMMKEKQLTKSKSKIDEQRSFSHHEKGLEDMTTDGEKSEVGAKQLLDRNAKAPVQTIDKMAQKQADKHHRKDKDKIDDEDRAVITDKNKQLEEIERNDDLHQKAIEGKSLNQELTLEAKRKKQMEHKMTIEEKRKMQNESASSQQSSFSQYFKQLKTTDGIFLVFLILCAMMNVYISLQMIRYLKLIYAGLFFVIITLMIVGIFILMVKKRSIGFICNLILTFILMFGSIGVYRLSAFSGKIFNNTETETVMIVAKKDSELDASSDFTDKKVAMVSTDAETNSFAEEILAGEQKHDYIKVGCQNYQEAYEQLMNDSVDFMVYTLQARQRLSEDEIDSWNQIKVIFQKNREREAVKSKIVDISEDPFNVLISGVDLTSENINEKGSSDVNILVSVNPQTKKIIMQTIPRDSWVALPCLDNRHTKLTYAGAWGGVDCSIKALENYLGIDINYYAKINFQGVMDLVDALGGISVYNDIAFCTPYTQRDGTSAEVCFQEGLNDIDGAQALIYSRIRKIFSDGDIERGRHQMAVIEGVINKFKQEPNIDHLNGLLAALENNFTTNFQEDDAMKALDLFLHMSNQLSDIPMYTMEGEMLWNTDEVTNEYLYYFYPDEGQIDLVRQRIDDLMNDK